jgi:hypothetical protein
MSFQTKASSRNHFSIVNRHHAVTAVVPPLLLTLSHCYRHWTVLSTSSTAINNCSNKSNNKNQQPNDESFHPATRPFPTKSLTSGIVGAVSSAPAGIMLLATLPTAVVPAMILLVAIGYLSATDSV